MKGDQPDDSLGAEEIAHPEAAGVIGRSQPGTPEADTFDAVMTDDLDAFDKELLKREGPDALTSDRALRLAQFRQQQAGARRQAVDAAEGDHDLTGYVLGVFRRQHGWSRDQLADWLGLDPEGYAQLAVERRPAVKTRECEYDRGLIELFADRFGAHPERLLEVFDRGDP